MKKYLIAFTILIAFFSVSYLWFSSLEPEGDYILLVDQRGLDIESAIQIAQEVCDQYSPAELYWVFNIEDTDVLDNVLKIKVPSGCNVTMSNSVGYSLVSACETFESLAGKPGDKCLIFCPSDYSSEVDEDVLRENLFQDNNIKIMVIGPYAGKKS